MIILLDCRVQLKQALVFLISLVLFLSPVFLALSKLLNRLVTLLGDPFDLPVERLDVEVELVDQLVFLSDLPDELVHVRGGCDHCYWLGSQGGLLSHGIEDALTCREIRTLVLNT
jgi:hypothetical protein